MAKDFFELQIIFCNLKYICLYKYIKIYWHYTHTVTLTTTTALTINTLMFFEVTILASKNVTTQHTLA